MSHTDQARPPHPESALGPGRFAALLAFFLLVCFPTVLLGFDTFFFRDYAFFGYPLAAWHRESFWAGELPLWNPYNNSGLPFLAQWNTMVLYPGALIYLLLPLPWSLSLFCLAHFYLAGLAMYHLARHWTGQNLPAAVAGVGFAFAGLALSCLKWPNNIAALGWMPLVILSVQQAWLKPRENLFRALLFGAMQMLAGAPEIILFTWFILGLLWLADLVRFPSRIRTAAVFLVTVLAVAALAAAQLLPFLDLLAHSQRERHFGLAVWPMPLTGLANFFLPVFNTFASYHGVLAQPDQYWISTYYLSLPVVALALLSLLLSRDRYVWILGLAAFFATWLALGHQGFLYKWLRDTFPFLSFMRFPIKFIVITAFAVPLLAAFGLREFLQRGKSSRATLLFLIIALAPLALAFLSQLSPEQYRHSFAVWKNAFFRSAFIAIFFVALLRYLKTDEPRRLAFLAFTFCFILWGDAITHAPWQNPTAPSWVYKGHAAELHPRPQLGESRAMISPPAYDKLDHLVYDTPVEDVLASRLSLYANANLIEDIPKVDGFFSLYLQNMSRIQYLLYKHTNPPPALLDFLAVSHITAPGKTLDWDKRPTALPWVTAGQVPHLLPPGTLLERMASPAFNPRQEVLFTLPGAAPVATASTNIKVLSSRISAHEWFVEVNAEKEALVVFSQAFHPNWKATIDNTPAQLLPANIAFQALAVPAGRHLIRLYYSDSAFRLGAVISTTTLLLTLILAALFHRPSN